jgi:hypothetical protein
MKTYLIAQIRTMDEEELTRVVDLVHLILSARRDREARAAKAEERKQQNRRYLSRLVKSQKANGGGA